MKRSVKRGSGVVLVALAAVTVIAACDRGNHRGGETARYPTDRDPRATAFVREMQAAYEHGSYRSALVLADSALRYEPGLPEVDFTRGLVYMKLGRHEDARAAFRRVQQLNPDYPGVLFNLGHLSFIEQQYREAIALYRGELSLLVEGAPSRTTAPADRAAMSAVKRQIGRAYARLGEADSAHVHYEQAVSLDSSSAELFHWMSELYEEEGVLDKALAHARRALERDPRNLEYGYRVGFLLFQTGRIEEAVPYLETVVQYWPAHEGATYNLGRALVALGREEEAKQYLGRVEQLQRLKTDIVKAQRAASLYADDPERWTRLAHLLVQAGYLEKARDAFYTALYLRPHDLALQNDLANLTLSMGDTTGALARFQAILRQDSTFADGWFNLGVLHALSGRLEAARDAWRTSLKYAPDHAEARASLARLEAAGDE